MIRMSKEYNSVKPSFPIQKISLPIYDHQIKSSSPVRIKPSRERVIKHFLLTRKI